MNDQTYENAYIYSLVSAGMEIAAAQGRIDTVPMRAWRVSIVIPAYEEGEAIVPVLARIAEGVTLSHEVIVVVDESTDSTASAIRARPVDSPPVRLLVNPYGPGPANAIRFGIDHACAPVVVVTMADGSDDPRLIDDLVRLVDRGVVIAAASRYMPGGQLVAAPFLKRTLSRLAGRSLYRLARVGTRDATNSFKAYATDFVRAVGIESRHGFEIGLELTAKARRLRRPVAEMPTIWLERQLGESRFRVIEWIPHYLHWYFFAFGPKLELDSLRQRTSREER
jgi:glycosyltransferase involved in cell wall biosynthesis